jgi:ParB-like chromosome segregation protein Spo0J
MKPHPISELLPAMSDDELLQLTADIREHGLHQPVVVYEGQILDGRHRFKACEASGVPPRFTEFHGDDAGAAALVYSANLARRQLSKSQLAIAGAKLKAWHAVRAKERQLAGLQASGKRGGKVPANSPEPIDDGDARDHAAKAVGVGGKLIDQAENVMRKAVPEVARLVEVGAMALNEAAKIAELPKDTQRRIAAQPTKTIRQGELRNALKKSSAGRKARTPQSQIVQPSDAPGSQLVRTLLSRLELLTNEIERSGLPPQKFAEQFVAEFDWSEPLLVKRLSYIGKAVDMIASLSVISQRARREAA